MHNDWRDIIKFLEEHFQINISFNPLFEDKALIRSSSGKLEDLIEKPGKSKCYGLFYLLFEKWNKLKHGRPEFIRGFGRWISIENLLLDYWTKDIFTAIGNYFGVLKNISFGTMNMTNVLEAKIKVKQNLSGLLPSNY